MKKRTISILLLMAILFTSVPAFAVETSRREGIEVPTRYTNITSISPALSVSGSTATYSLTVKCPTDVTKIGATLQIQKKNSNGTYSDFGASWKAESKSYSLYTSGTKTVTSGGTYRLKVTVIASTSSGSSMATAYS